MKIDRCLSEEPDKHRYFLNNLRSRKIIESLVDTGSVLICRHCDWNLVTYH
jgi:hypothetical protein